MTVGQTTAVTTTPSPYLRAEDCRLSDLLTILEAATEGDLAAYPHASAMTQGVLIYDAAPLRESLVDDGARQAVHAEIARALMAGPGIVVFTGAFDPAVIDPVSAAFERIIAQEKADGRVAGDHFAAPGANDRMWNALEKLAIADPAAFVGYYANDIVALAATAWLGPGYQVTSQVNIVGPGGKGQTVHRDYHLGFQDPKVSEQFPTHVHALSPVLTLQGAVAHIDMPVQTGPTLYLPHSQKYPAGYLAYWLPEFQDYFVRHHIQLPLRKGDAVFFNPALFHAAGSNITADVRRMANLLQISSPFGRAMETIDRARVVEAIYPALLAAKDAGMPPADVDAVVAASAEGYAFPTNLDRDQPVGGMSPSTQADLVRAALGARVSADELHETLSKNAFTRLSH
ncbi:MAG: phytanoyl-CoA dioxygenase family protein [Phycicoccus sp.]|nr:phytanoyl-CoA dioxygenase family protein [Phycicoccus sp.]